MKRSRCFGKKPLFYFKRISKRFNFQGLNGDIYQKHSLFAKQAAAVAGLAKALFCKQISS